MTNEPPDLLAVVDLLTRPRKEHVAQQVNDQWKVRAVQVPPLLYQFRDRVNPSGETTDSSSSSTKSTRSIANLEALYAYAKMTSTAAGWAHDGGSRPTRDPVIDIRAWYSATLADNARDDDWYRRHLSGWVSTIRDYLEPPEKMILRQPCPVCQGTAWGDAINGGDLWPIQVRWREDEQGKASGHLAVCRIPTCGTRWIGREAVIELSEELAERAA